MRLDVLTLAGKKAGAIELDDAIFALEPRADILQRMVKWQLAKRRAGTHKSQERGDVARTGKKLYRQKGTGGARHGQPTAGLFRGGAKAHGPHPRSYEHALPKKVRRLALAHALSAKAGAKAILVLDEAKLDEPKTKALKAAFEKLELTNALVIGGAELDVNFVRAARNLPDIDVLPFAGLNVYDVLRRRTLVLTKEAVAAIHDRFKPAAPEKEAA